MLPTLQPNHSKSAGPPGPQHALSVQGAQLGNSLTVGEGSWQAAIRCGPLVTNTIPGPSQTQPLPGFLHGAGKEWVTRKIAMNGVGEREVSYGTGWGVLSIVVCRGVGAVGFRAVFCHILFLKALG